MVKTAENSRIVRLHLTCVAPPPVPSDKTEVELGLQDRHEAITPGHLRSDGSLQYEIGAAIIHQPETSEARWRGSYVHGKPAAPFLYLSLKSHSVQATGWIRRLKIPLPHLSWDQVEATHTPLCFAATIAGSGSGTVPLLGDGWTRQEQALAEQ